MSTGQDIPTLRARLADLRGRARCPRLVQLAEAHAEAYWRAGVGRPTSLPELDAAISAMREAYDLMEPADPWRHRVAHSLGTFYSSRATAHFGGESDSEEGIRLLNEALTATDLDTFDVARGRMTLAQLFLSRAVAGLQSPELFKEALRSGVPAAAKADADHSADLLRSVLAAEQTSPEVTKMAEMLLTNVEAVRELLDVLGRGAESGGLDMARMMKSMGVLQETQQRMQNADGIGGLVTAPPVVPRFVPPQHGGVPRMFDPDVMAGMDVLDHPATLVYGREPANPPATGPAERTVPAVPAPDRDALRFALLDMVSALAAPATGEHGGREQISDDPAALHLHAAALVRPDTPPPAVGAVDELIGLATTIVYGGDDADSASAGVNRFVLAVAHLLRARRQPSADDADRLAAAEHLLAAAELLPGDHPAAATLTAALPAFVEGAAGGCATQLDGALAPHRAAEAFQALDGTTQAGQVGAAVRALAACAMVYTGPAGPGGVRLLLVKAGAETVEDLGTVVSETAVAVVADRLGPAPRRVLVAAADRLAWAAADTPDLVISFVASGRQAVELSSRPSRPVTEAAVFVANPEGDRDADTVQAMALRRMFHPDSVGLGLTVERVGGRGTPADVLAHLPGPGRAGASLLSLGCGLTGDETPALRLAGDVLDLATILAQADGGGTGGVVILPPDAAAHPGWSRLADGLLTAGMTGVVGWLRPVPGPVAATMLFMLHVYLVDGGAEPAAAVHAVRQWMRDPGRVTPTHLPSACAAAGYDLGDPSFRTALCYLGR